MMPVFDHALARFTGFVFVAGAFLLLFGAVAVRAYVEIETHFGVLQ